MKVALVNTEEHSHNYIETVLDTLIGMTVVVKGKTDSIEYVECFDKTPSPSVLVVFDNTIYLDGTLEPVDMFIKTFQTSTKPTVKGLKVCITGDFSNLRERMCEFLKSQGVVIQGHVSKDLNFLLVGEGSGKNAKVSKANEYGTTRGGLDKFLDTYDLHKEWDEFKPTQPNIEELAKQIRQIYVDAVDNTRLIRDWSDLSETTKTRFRAIAKHFATPSSTLQQSLTESLESERELMGYLREIGKIFGKKVGVDIGVQDVVGLVDNQFDTLRELRNSLITALNLTYVFETFTDVDLINMVADKTRAAEKSVDKLTTQEVAELFMKLTDTTLFRKGKEWGLINNDNHEEIASLKLTDEQRENLRKMMVEHSQLSGDVSVGYRIDLDSVDFGFDLSEKPDLITVTYTPEPASHVVQTIRDTINTGDVKSSFVLEKWSNGEITVNNQNIGEWLVDCYEPIAANKVIEAVRNLK